VQACRHIMGSAGMKTGGKAALSLNLPVIFAQGIGWVTAEKTQKEKFPALVVSAEMNQDQSKDHKREGRHLEDLRRDGRKNILQEDAAHLQETEEIGAKGHFQGMPAAEDNQGQGDPSHAFASLRSSPARLDRQGKGGAGKTDQGSAEKRVDGLYLPGLNTTGPAGLGIFSHAAQDKSLRGLVDEKPEQGDGDKTGVDNQ